MSLWLHSGVSQPGGWRWWGGMGRRCHHYHRGGHRDPSWVVFPPGCSTAEIPGAASEPGTVDGADTAPLLSPEAEATSDGLGPLRSRSGWACAGHHCSPALEVEPRLLPRRCVGDTCPLHGSDTPLAHSRVLGKPCPGAVAGSGPGTSGRMQCQHSDSSGAWVHMSLQCCIPVPGAPGPTWTRPSAEPRAWSRAWGRTGQGDTAGGLPSSREEPSHPRNLPGMAGISSCGG